jgi:hypothetical protein
LPALQQCRTFRIGQRQHDGRRTEKPAQFQRFAKEADRAGPVLVDDQHSFQRLPLVGARQNRQARTAQQGGPQRRRSFDDRQVAPVALCGKAIIDALPRNAALPTAGGNICQHTGRTRDHVQLLPQPPRPIGGVRQCSFGRSSGTEPDDEPLKNGRLLPKPQKSNPCAAR